MGLWLSLPESWFSNILKYEYLILGFWELRIMYVKMANTRSLANITFFFPEPIDAV